MYLDDVRMFIVKVKKCLLHKKNSCILCRDIHLKRFKQKQRNGVFFYKLCFLTPITLQPDAVDQILNYLRQNNPSLNYLRTWVHINRLQKYRDCKFGFIAKSFEENTMPWSIL